MKFRFDDLTFGEAIEAVFGVGNGARTAPRAEDFEEQDRPKTQDSHDQEDRQEEDREEESHEAELSGRNRPGN